MRTAQLQGGVSRWTSQWLNYQRDSYLERTSRPITAMVFLLPFLLLYEAGTLWVNTDQLTRSEVRVVAFVWLQEAVGFLNIHGRFAWMAPPLVVLMILLGMQLASGKPWRVTWLDLPRMFVECALLAIPLIVLSLAFNSRPVAAPSEQHLRGTPESVSMSMAGPETVVCLQATPAGASDSLVSRLVTGIGAGIYEELVFRLVLMVGLVLLLQDGLGMSQRHALLSSVLISAALFSIHHHFVVIHGQWGQTSVFDWSEFLFRTVAGIYFAVLFVLRGFGITVGTHALYDVLATCLNAFWFA